MYLAFLRHCIQKSDIVGHFWTGSEGLVDRSGLFEFVISL